MTLSTRKDFYKFENGEKPPLQFSQAEYDLRINGLRNIMIEMGIEATVLTSMHCVSYYTGFTYCSFGRPYACVVTHDHAYTISAGIDGGQPARRSSTENIIYSDWKRDNFWRAVKSCISNANKIVDVAPASMKQRMIKSNDELELIRQGARIADIGGFAIHDAISVGAREIDIAMAGRDAMEFEIAKSFPHSELRDTWVWFQSGVNTDGAHNPVTTRKLVEGDILSLNTFPMISGYYTALERTLFIGEPNKESLKVWEANIEAHELGISLIKEGATCSGITAEINSLFEEKNLLQYRSFGYGHSFGVLSHYYGREAGLELREDIDTELTSNMVVSMEPMITIPDNNTAGGGYREHDILVLHDGGVENITMFPYGPEHNIVNC